MTTDHIPSRKADNLREPEAVPPTEGSALARRRFLAATSGLAVTAALSAGAAAEEPPKKPQPGAPGPDDVRLPPGATVPMRRLGRTGVKVSALGLGGFHIGLAPDQATATRLIHTAVDLGVTFMDNCWDYHDGKSHEWMGHALRDGYRQKVFLMTKIDGRTRQAAAAQIDQSLRALGTDVIDLMQIHEVIRPSDAARVFAPDGAMEALFAARKAGKIRFIGFTGHKSPDIHLTMLSAATKNGFVFDAVQLPLNLMDAHYDSFERKVLPVLVKQDIGVLAMKPLGSGLFFKSKPLIDRAVSPSECLQYALNLPTSVVITGCDTLGILKQGVDAAIRFKPFTKAAVRGLLARTALTARHGEWEKYKTSEAFDGTTKHPWWLDSASVKG